MNFQGFCDAAKEIDQQTVSTSDTFVISFSKPDGSAFSVDPNDIVDFLQFLSDNHSDFQKTIEDEPRFNSDKTYLNYQEKPYRALYKLAGDKGLKTISSLGGSQTKELTKIISKLLSFVAGLDYQKVEDNTYLDKKSIDIALSKMPSNLRVLGASKDNQKPKASNKELFKAWLKSKELSEKTVQSYSETCISFADKLLLEDKVISASLYSFSSAKDLEPARNWLDNNGVWIEKNNSGNGMYSAGVSKYIEFLSQNPSQTKIPKPFILLAGISGTGKTRFVRKQAESHNLGKENFCLVPVRPDWHEPSDLLGYVSRIDGTKYVATKVLKFIIEAWKVVAPNASKNGMGDLELASAPYWLCLDEMNLAPVEQYFADYLSVLESRKFEGGVYSCDPLLDKSLFETLPCMQKDLGLENDQDLWELFSRDGVCLPPNLIVAGTVNMDETTHGFSRKVIDRALSIDFGEFFPNEYSKFFGGQAVPKVLTYSTETQAEPDSFTCNADSDGDKTINFLQKVNDVLRNTPFELAYRALNELLLYVNAFAPKDDQGLQAVWDDFLMTKVLPRIDGDDDKLRVADGDDTNNLLDKLETVLAKKLNLIWDEGKTRLDLLRYEADGSDIRNIECRSRKKIKWMKGRLENNTFTSYWP